MILVKKIWDKIIELCEIKYGLNATSVDIRFMYLVYTYYLKDNDVKKRIKIKDIVHEAHKNYLYFFKDVDRVNFTSFQRSVYRAAEKINREEHLDKLIETITNDLAV
jgi:hypothetical protein